MANDKITRLPKRHKHAGQGLRGFFDLFDLETKRLAESPNRPADPWAQIAQGFVFGCDFLFSFPFRAADQIGQLQKKDPAEGSSIIGLVIACPVSRSASP